MAAKSMHRVNGVVINGVGVSMVMTACNGISSIWRKRHAQQHGKVSNVGGIESVARSNIAAAATWRQTMAASVGR